MDNVCLGVGPVLPAGLLQVCSREQGVVHSHSTESQHLQTEQDTGLAPFPTTTQFLLGMHGNTIPLESPTGNVNG